MLSKLSQVDRSRKITEFIEAGILKAAIGELNSGVNEEFVCSLVVNSLLNIAAGAKRREVDVPQLHNDTLLRSVVYAMKCFPASKRVQGDCCKFFHKVALNCVEALAEIGVFDAVVGALENFPATFQLFRAKLYMCVIFSRYIFPSQ